MSKMSRKDRLIENEVIFRDVNRNIQEFAEEEGKDLVGDVMSFYCECSRPNCIERIELKPKEYKKLHKGKKHFITIVGHEFPEVEKVLTKKNGYQLVEKYITPPSARAINLALKEINSAVSAT